MAHLGAMFGGIWKKERLRVVGDKWFKVRNKEENGMASEWVGGRGEAKRRMAVFCD